MSRTLQLQRDAIDTLIEFLNPISILPDNEFFLDGKRVYLRGISKGLGSLSATYGKNVAVFTSEECQIKRVAVQVCGGVLLRDATKEECSEVEGTSEGGVRTVEALELSKKIQFARDIHMTKTGHKKSYVVIC